MNIDDFIKHTKEKAREHRYHADFFESDNPMNVACIKSAEDCECLADCLTKFKDYQQLEEQGLLLRLPCGIGTIVYEVENNADACSECSDFEKGYYCDDCCGNKDVHDENGGIYVSNPQYADKPLCQKHFYEVNEYTMSNVDEIFNMRRAFGKTVFLTKEEAEERLRELMGRKEQ